MYLAIDVGGTKTLFAVVDGHGKIVKQHKLPTPMEYPDFLKMVVMSRHGVLKDYNFTAACCAMPGRVDHEAGVITGFGNLPWHAIPVKKDLSHSLGLEVLIENDAKLAGLSEARRVMDTYNKALYLTISTGIGGGLISDGKIDPELAHAEPGQILLEHDGQLVQWEKFASGHAIVERYGKKAADINDEATWRKIVKDLSVGMYDLIATMQPDVVIIGGSVGSHFKKYGALLNSELKKLETTLVPIPPVVAAKYPEEAVIYGCYDFIKQHQA